MPFFQTQLMAARLCPPPFLGALMLNLQSDSACTHPQGLILHLADAPPGVQVAYLAEACAAEYPTTQQPDRAAGAAKRVLAKFAERFMRIQQLIARGSINETWLGNRKADLVKKGECAVAVAAPEAGSFDAWHEQSCTSTTCLFAGLVPPPPPKGSKTKPRMVQPASAATQGGAPRADCADAGEVLSWLTAYNRMVFKGTEKEPSMQDSEAAKEVEDVYSRCVHWRQVLGQQEGDDAKAAIAAITQFQRRAQYALG